VASWDEPHHETGGAPVSAPPDSPHALRFVVRVGMDRQHNYTGQCACGYDFPIVANPGRLCELHVAHAVETTGRK
jgi:hypothetical protein